MDLNKHLEFFNPTSLKKEQIHIIGCGAIGSNVALQLAKLGIEELTIWDFDIVTDHNITNQVYDINDINKPKTDAIERHLKDQNPNIKIIKRRKYTNEPLSGIVIVCVDSVKIRLAVANCNYYNTHLKLFLDGRIGLEQGQVYCINWENEKDKDNYIQLTDFDDSDVSTPISACGTTLSVSPSVLITASYIVACLINYANNKQNPNFIRLDAFKFKTII